MKKRNLLLVFVLILSSFACRLTPATEAVEDLGCAEAVAGIRDLREQYPFPDYFMDEKAVERGGEFDPMLYFTVLDHLSMEDGYVMDFVYTYDFMGGFPTLLARPETEAPYLSWEDVPADPLPALDHVRTDGTAAGYMQYVLLAIMGEQFYLYWHAGYSDAQVICNQAALETLLAGTTEFSEELPADVQRKARGIENLEPQVEIGDTTVQVRVVIFTKWGGFYRLTFTINREFPNTIQSTQDEQLVPYDCGIMF
jgi:hypothetical protein